MYVYFVCEELCCDVVGSWVIVAVLSDSCLYRGAQLMKRLSAHTLPSRDQHPLRVVKWANGVMDVSVSQSAFKCSKNNKMWYCEMCMLHHFLNRCSYTCFTDKQQAIHDKIMIGAIKHNCSLTMFTMTWWRWPCSHMMVAPIRVWQSRCNFINVLCILN